MTRGSRADRATSTSSVLPRSSGRARLTLCGCGLVALIVLSGCTTGSDAGTLSLPTSTLTPTTTAVDFDLGVWLPDNQVTFDRATSAMTRFAEAVEAGEVAPAQDAAFEVRRMMTELASGLDTETGQVAIDLRDDFAECSRAYGAVEDALANADPEAFEASGPLFAACFEIAVVEQP